MKLKKLKLEGSTDETNHPHFLKLGKHSFLVNDNLLAVFVQKDQDYDCLFYHVTPVDKNILTDDYTNKIKTALTKVHKKILEKIAVKSVGQNAV